MNHHPDLTPGVMAALSWFYLTSSILNACASAYISYGELVSEGASRDGLGPKTISMPAWLRMSTWLFYGFGSLFLLINIQVAFWLLAAGTVILIDRMTVPAASSQKATCMLISRKRLPNP